MLRLCIISAIITAVIVLLAYLIMSPDVSDATTTDVHASSQVDSEHHVFEPNAPMFIRILKTEAVLQVWTLPKNGTRYLLRKTYPVLAFSGKLGPKLKEGDKQAPEGFYASTRSSLNPRSRYHRSFNIGYPNAYDKAHARTGSWIMIHGGNVSIGCFALGNAPIEELYNTAEKSIAKHGSIPIQIYPFAMTDENMEKHATSEHLFFWKNLKEGWDLTEKKGIPPKISVKNKRYVFE